MLEQTTFLTIVYQPDFLRRIFSVNLLVTGLSAAYACLLSKITISAFTGNYIFQSAFHLTSYRLLAPFGLVP
ncbi:MAG TPA: hypothetical protein DCQ47_07850 [Gammaproteobacteria bacterium]|nr:hypothetical protein [Gammaproteobacteria bacterium]